MTTYSPSPRPTFDGPTAIPFTSVTRHVWGDAEAGEVADWIYASTGKIHCLVFGLPVNGAFRHSREFLTVFGADEWLCVLEGTLAISNPETGEVERIPTGGSVFFRKDTWHHAFACDGEPLKVVEFFSPPPSTGSSGAYARTRPYLEESRYADDALLGNLLPGAPRTRTLHAVREGDLVWRRDLGALVGLACSTEHLTAGHLEVQAGETAVTHTHDGDEVLYVTAGRAARAGVARRRDARVRAAPRRRLLPAGGRAPRVPQLRRRDGARGVRRGTLLRVRVLGIDVGGTKLAAGIVDVATGEVTERRMWPTDPARGPDAVLADLVRCAAELAPERIGLGVCELVDLAGRTTSAYTIDWRDRHLADAFAVPCTVESDVRAAALAESRFGAGRGRSSFLYVTISTGISHCLVIAGKPWAGARGNAIVTGNPPAELLASGRGLQEAAGRDSAQDVLWDPACAPIVERAASELAGAIAGVVDAVDPEAIVLGGGLGLERGYSGLWEPDMRARLFSRDTAKLDIVEAELGPDAGIVGAALAAV